MNWSVNKPVTITREEIIQAFVDLLGYYENQEENRNIKAVKQALKEILRNEV